MASKLLRAGVLGAVLVFGGTAASAQQPVPAEIPPASFTGAQYIDSAGCVFIRVGFGAATEWVPRVSRDRRQICGQTPTRIAGAGPARPGPGVVVIGAAPAPAAPAPAAAPARTVIREVPAPAAPAATPSLRIIAAPPPAAATAPRPAPAAAPAVTCPGLTGLTAQYLSGPGQRCGPQAVHPGDRARGIVRPGPAFVTPSAHTPARIPQGYRPAWDDGRHNPLRGVGTATGTAQMGLVWTDDVPARLVTDAHGVRRLLATPATRTPALGTPRARAPLAADPAPEAAAGAPRLTVLTRDRHVLAGSYATRAEAEAAHARLAGAGLGAVLRQGGAGYRLVAGPYADTDAVVAALRAAHAAGFAGAVTIR